MEDLREAARAYYSNAPEEVKQQADNLFRVMDTDGDGEISSYEFIQYVLQAGYNVIPPNFFYELDHDGDGRLDFWELLTFFYAVKTRTTICDHCGAHLMRPYFTCVECFECAKDSYDLCISCYREGQFQHQHTVFSDDLVMLMTNHPLFASNRFSSITVQPQPHPQPLLLLQPQIRDRAVATRSNWNTVKTAFEAFELALSTWDVASQLGCSIM